jgi:hypothetical protein
MTHLHNNSNNDPQNMSNDTTDSMRIEARAGSSYNGRAPTDANETWAPEPHSHAVEAVVGTRHAPRLPVRTVCRRVVHR